MTLYSYQIGTTTSLTNLESLTTPVPAPKGFFKPYSGSAILGDGTVRGMGFPVAVWHWGFLTRAQRDQLRQFCTGKSANVYICTKANDSTDTYKYYSCVMIWPDEEERDAGRRLSFDIQFRNLVQYTP